MSDYEYTNDNYNTIEVGRYFDNVLIHVVGGTTAAIEVDAHEAPALALAILEAAGVDATRFPSDHLTQAAWFLVRHDEVRAKQAEREAEDAKIQEFFDTMQEAGGEDDGAWGDLTDYAQNRWRKQYRALRGLFQAQA